MTAAALLISLKVTAAATVLIFVVGGGLALVLARHDFRGRTVLETLLHLPLVLPPSVVGYYLLIGMGREGPRYTFEEMTEPKLLVINRQVG